MRPVTILIFLIVQASLGQQLAIINDPDGYVNVRISGLSQAPIVGKIFDGDVFYADYENEADEWWDVSHYAVLDSIEAFKQEYYRTILGAKYDVSFQGFAHRSRITLISKLQLASTRAYSSNGTSLTLSDKSIEVTISTGLFDSLKHEIKKGVSVLVSAVDGRKPWGQDGGMPQIEIQSISLKMNGKVKEFPRHLYSDLYEPNLGQLNLHFVSNGYWILAMPDNSDGAGHYDVAWIIKDKQAIKRVILTL